MALLFHPILPYGLGGILLFGPLAIPISVQFPGCTPAGTLFSGFARFHRRSKLETQQEELCVGGTRVQRREASGGAARATGRRRQKSAGRRSDHGRLTTCGQAPGGRASDQEDREAARTGRGWREGGLRWGPYARLCRTVLLHAGRQESPRPRRPAPAPESAPRGFLLHACGPAWSTPPAFKSIPARDPQLPHCGCSRSPPPKAAPLPLSRPSKYRPCLTGIHLRQVPSLLLPPSHSRRK
ncbi:PREDICTED: uncharacterized protein LOC103600837 [Galeopterus variegatus]|uniref:Uncharacterized protein LOC103600837 n=1 Tax=Galeopterus variegatus TaxID=482537 RepID=A0ABM0RS10_GALVR|nr:PREDICTED: uncharacterized protein LOC103600837 [Galeopterus variegatus]